MIGGLLQEQMVECSILDKKTSPDGYGGIDITWEEGAPFDAAIVLDTSMQARTAQKAGVTALYTVTTSRNVNLQYHDVFIRSSDHKVFRVTSDGDDKLTPSSATLDMRQVSAEEWELVNG